MSCILDQSVWSKRKLLLIYAMKKNFIRWFCSAAFIGVLSSTLCPSSAVECGQVDGFLFTVPHITHLSSLSPCIYTYPKAFLHLYGSLLFCDAIWLNYLTPLRFIVTLPFPTSLLVTHLNFAVLPRGHILLQKACSHHRHELARFAVDCKEWNTKGNTTTLGKTPGGSEGKCKI